MQRPGTNSEKREHDGCDKVQKWRCILHQSVEQRSQGRSLLDFEAHKVSPRVQLRRWLTCLVRGEEAGGGGGPEQSFQAIEQELELEEHELLLRVKELEDKLMLRTKQHPSSSDPELDPNQGVPSADEGGPTVPRWRSMPEPLPRIEFT